MISIQEERPALIPSIDHELDGDQQLMDINNTLFQKAFSGDFEFQHGLCQSHVLF